MGICVCAVSVFTDSSIVKHRMRLFSPSAFCFSSLSRPWNGMELLSLQVKPSPASRGVSSGRRSACQCLYPGETWGERKVKWLFNLHGYFGQHVFKHICGVYFALNYNSKTKTWLISIWFYLSLCWVSRWPCSLSWWYHVLLQQPWRRGRLEGRSLWECAAPIPALPQTTGAWLAPGPQRRREKAQRYVASLVRTHTVTHSFSLLKGVQQGTRNSSRGELR